MPDSWASMLNSIWRHQKRYLQLAGQTSPVPQNVLHSLPQGDPWSLVAMSAILLSPVLAAKRVPGVACVTFVDDRTIIADDLHSCMEAANSWQQWSALIGLRENRDKEQYYHKDLTGRKQFLDAGIEAHKVTDALKSLALTCVVQEKGLWSQVKFLA